MGGDFSILIWFSSNPLEYIQVLGALVCLLERLALNSLEWFSLPGWLQHNYDGVWADNAATLR